MTKVFSTVKPVKKKRRRIGEFTKEIREFKNSLTTFELIRLELKVNQLQTT